jgi:hypothetical protein
MQSTWCRPGLHTPAAGARITPARGPGARSRQQQLF